MFVIDAGVWASAVISVSGSRIALLEALPFVLIFAPALARPEALRAFR
jgi:hypothetical protein